MSFIDLKRWFLVATVCVLGWVFGFAIYWMIGPKILPVVNTQLHQRSAPETVREVMQKPALDFRPIQPQLRDAVFHGALPGITQPVRRYYL